MDERILNDRRAALEDAFFARQNDALLRRLREADGARSRKESLSAATGIKDEALLQQLDSLGIDADALIAFALVPLVRVAWADGSIDSNERRAVLSRAQAAGLPAQGTGRKLFENWLAEPPPPAVFSAWKAYIGTLGDERRDLLKAEILDRTRAVAAAAGGFLGMLGTVSPAEERVLREVEAAFE